MCGHEHYQSDPHVFKDEPKQPRPVNVNKPTVNINKCAQCALKDERIAELEQRLDRKEYMREYMRKRRAASQGPTLKAI